MLMRILRKGVAALLVLVIAGFHVPMVVAHEVPVHKAITDLAVDYLIQQRPELAACGEPEIRQQLKFGVDHEDDWAFNSVPIGDFFFHFQGPLLQPLHDVVKPGSLPNLEVSASCSASDWLFGGGPCERGVVVSPASALGVVAQNVISVTKRSNDFVYNAVLGDLLSPYGSPGKAKGVIGLGHVIHLLQDMTSPAHTRNDAHPHVTEGPSLLQSLDDASAFEVVNLQRVIRWKNGAGVGPSIFPMPTDPLIDPFPVSFMSDLRAQTHSQAYSEKNLATDVATGNGPVVEREANGYKLDDEGRAVARVNPNPFGSPVMINDVVAAAQLVRLVPEAILWTASLLNFVQGTHPICETLLRVESNYGSVISSSDLAGEGIDCSPFEGRLACDHRFPSGAPVTLTAKRVIVPSENPDFPPLWDSGEFVGWLGACAGQGPVCQLTMGQLSGSNDPQARLDIETIPLFERTDCCPTLDSHPDASIPPSFQPRELDPFVNGNQVQLSGNWRVRHQSGDADDYNMAVAIEDPFHRGQVLHSGRALRLTDNFSRRIFFGAEGEQGGITAGLPQSQDVVGVLRFWIDDGPDYPAPILLEVRPVVAPNWFEIVLGNDDEDPTEIDVTLELVRLPD